MTLWHKKENHYPPRWICITHIWSPTLFPRGILIFQGVLAKLNFYEHPPTHQTYPKCHSVTIHILWMAHGVGGDGMVGGFTGWVSGWWGGWMESSWVGGGVGG